MYVAKFSGCFSALQRAEIAEIRCTTSALSVNPTRFSALQRAEIAEMPLMLTSALRNACFSALQRAEIAEI